jgi:hypothetical protein
MFSSDLFKSLGLAAVLFVAIFLYYKKFISKTIFIFALGFVALFDLFKVDLQYFDASNFSDAIEAEANFNPTPTDAALLKDTSYYIYPRVFLCLDIFLCIDSSVFPT